MTPVYIKDFKWTELSGVSFSNRSISIFRNNKKIKEHQGDFGFTHKGLSGPGILDFSRFIESGDILKINFTNSNAEELRNTFIADTASEGKISIKNYLKRFELPESLIKQILNSLQIDFSTQLATVNKDLRGKLIESISNHPFIIENIGNYNIAMATAGGIDTSQVESKTMQSKIIPGLYFAGEVLDIDGDTGGYNIQAAFSTGFLVAKNIKNRESND